MYRTILAPVDLTHVARLGKAIDTACDLAVHYGTRLVFVGVTATTPTPVAHNPHEFERKLAEFAAEQERRHGIAVESRAYTAHDPAVQIDDTLLQAVEDTGADLVVMASHLPNVVDAIWPSRGGRVASHAPVSVFLVR
ncbi:MAG: universal stress protein [Alphaproteobacteria bacterium]|jgi:nucleotide-binding universal stress UspA family protein|nr:universal stress protein [Alphaproteobacteria bacterium]